MTSVSRPPCGKKILSVILLVLGLSVSTKAQGLAETSIPCFSRSAKISVFNPTKSRQTLWQQAPGLAELPPEENSWNINPGEHLTIPLKCSESSASVSFIQASSAKLELTVNDKEVEALKPARIFWGVSSDLLIQQGPEHLTLLLANPTASEQTVEIRNSNTEAVYKSLRLKSYETQKVSFRGFTRGVHIKAELRISAIAYDEIQHHIVETLPLDSGFKASNIDSNSARFEIAEQSGSSSFVVELIDPNLIQQARAYLSDFSTSKFPKILVGHIEPGSGNYNIDLRDSHKSPWSWHVSKAFRWADFGSIDCDGSPSQIEKNTLWWIDSKNSLICFWGYHLVQEIKTTSK